MTKVTEPYDPLLYYHREYDPNLAPYANQYFLKLRWLYNSGMRFHSEWVTHALYQGRIQLSGRHMHVMLLPVGEAINFEFGTSGWPLSVADDKYNGLTVMGTVRPKTNDDLSRTLEIRAKVEGPRATTPRSKVNRPYDMRTYPAEPVCFPPIPVGNTLGTPPVYDYLLYESWAPLHSFTGVFESCLGVECAVTTYNYASVTMPVSGYYGWYGSRPASIDRSVGYDVPFTLGNDSKKAQAAYLQDPADWPRASAIQKVVDDTYGKRVFGISVDAYGQFSVFPVDAIKAIDPDHPLDQNVPADFVKMHAPSLPGWCWKPTVRARDAVTSDSVTPAWTVQQPDTDWKFSADGTKACCIFMQRTLAEWDSSYFDHIIADGGGGYFPWVGGDALAAWKGRTGAPSRWATAAGATVSDLYSYGPGVVEAKINIEITGPDLQDFDFTITAATVRDPTTTNRCTMLAGYSWVDIPDKLISAGDLLTIDIERWYVNDQSVNLFYGQDLTITYPPVGDPIYTYSDVYADAIRGRIGTSFMVLRQVKTGDTVTEMTLFPFYGSAIAACDLRQVAFVVELDYREESVRAPAYSGYGDAQFFIAHPGMAVWVNAEIKEVLTPSGMDPAKVATVTSLASYDPSLDVAGLTYLAFNDLRAWSDDDLSFLRDCLLYANNWYNFTGAGQWNDQTRSDGVFVSTHPIPHGDLSVATRSFWTYGVCVNSNMQTLLLSTTPCFGWNAYTSEIINRMQMSKHTSFMVHPNGTWMLFNNERIYNTYGTCIPFIDADGDYLDAGHTITGSPNHIWQLLRYSERMAGWLLDWDDALFAAGSSVFSHCIFDRVHFEMYDPQDTEHHTLKVKKDTSFREIYNLAVGDPAPDAPVQPMAPLDLKATLTLQHGTLINASGSPSAGIACVKVEWGNGISYIFEQRDYSAYLTLAGTFYKPLLSGWWWPTSVIDSGESWLDSVGGYIPAGQPFPFWCTQARSIPIEKFPPVFSSPVVIGL
jgi:hypothetical protein